MSINFAKLSLFSLYYRIFGANPKTRIAIYLGALLNSCFYLACSIVYVVLCDPWRGEDWRSPKFLARYARITELAIPLAIFGLLSDLYIFFLPLPDLWRLQMALKKKLGVTAVFFTGFM